MLALVHLHWSAVGVLTIGRDSDVTGAIGNTDDITILRSNKIPRFEP